MKLSATRGTAVKMLLLCFLTEHDALCAPRLPRALARVVPHGGQRLHEAELIRLAAHHHKLLANCCVRVGKVIAKIARSNNRGPTNRLILHPPFIIPFASHQAPLRSAHSHHHTSRGQGADRCVRRGVSRDVCEALWGSAGSQSALPPSAAGGKGERWRRMGGQHDRARQGRVPCTGTV